MELHSFSTMETESIGKKIAAKLKGKEFVALYGDLGAGKTALVRGMADFLGIKDSVSSPTFSIMNEYKCSKFLLYHFDMYRITCYEDLESTGFFDYIGNGVIITEWTENIEKELPEETIKIYLKKDPRYSYARVITLEGIDIQ